ncbi:enoyl-CoA delta isomerase 2, mitochondrial-like isoform X2 [Hyalella azteca]|uniref:Enoyl-CoA delta isomerase 2 n=1 Tax=Hyalella azteca TaxID=294128 RepID=A0A6A0GX86_HYAAZ|nr:enoyl-CoA delta isomerase 2 [Hyalella azteca]KAA0191426.1 enoyl-CoA delta isomerase 2, mitochondrial-like isoform X2 [Hyalella azteca]
MVAKSFLAASIPFRRCFFNSTANHVVNVQACRNLGPSFIGGAPRYMSSSIAQQFEEVKHRLASLKEDPGNEVKLKMYALYKQGMEGKATGKRPGVMDFVARAKWDAWNSLADMSKEEALKAYLAIVDELSAAQGATSTEEPSILVTVEDGLRIIKLNRPKKKNALNPEMYFRWTELMHEAAKDDKTVLTAITGAGDFFCSGNDLGNFMNIPPGGEAELANRTKEFLYQFIDAFIEFPKPLIGVVNGPAVGVSVTTLGLYDAVYSSDQAWFQTPFSQLGQTAEGCSSYVFPRLMGPGIASEMLMFNKKLSAHEAQRYRLVTEVFPHDRLQQEVWPRLQALAKLPARCLIYSKELTRAADKEILKKTNRAECERLCERWQSEDCKNAIMNFFSRQRK